MRRSYWTALGIALAASAWVAYGEYGARLGLAAPRKQATVALPAHGKPEAPLQAVRTLSSEASSHMREVVARGRTEAKRKVEIKSEIVGRVVELPVAKGQRVKRGELLARLAIDDRQAWMAEAKAQVRQRQLEYDAAVELNRKGFRSDTNLAAAGAALDAARARVARMEVEIDRTAIRAPFDGVVETRAAEIGAFVKDGTAVATLVDENPYLVVANVTEQEIARLTLGAPGRAQLVTGETLEGRIGYLASTAEPATRTFRVELEVANPGLTLRDGVTAELRLPTETLPAHLLPPSTLTLDDKGVVGVRCVTAENTVVFHPVQIVKETPNGLWLAGLPARVQVIVVGQDFVREGERVRVLTGKGSLS
ncbi:MAG: efflux RND transporter periplasmic adaptor subunit [Alphaproteobacteria bacterium]|nr:efflux RND transporter periplasmic adaptor subunit [Alphaproteobacteria bacterium]